MSGDECEGRELLYPFVCVASVGGPYDDESFAAGWSCGEIAARLAAAHPEGIQGPFTMRASLVRQLDLVAMHYGFVLVTVGPMEDEDGVTQEWTTVNFEPSAVAE